MLRLWLGQARLVASPPARTESLIESPCRENRAGRGKHRSRQHHRAANGEDRRGLTR